MSRPAAGGYTLLEMVVVISILALTTAMVAPAGYRMIASWTEASKVDAVVKTLRTLPALARAQGRELRMLPAETQTQVRIFRAGIADREPPKSDDDLIELPDGWQITFDERLTVLPNGACSDSRGTLLTDRQTLEFEISAPFCRTRIRPAGNP